MMITDIHKLLDAEVKKVTGLPTLYTENMASNEKTGSKWARSTMLPARPAVTSLGVSYTELVQGILQVDLFYPKDRGYQTAGAVADAIVAAFRPSTKITTSTYSIQIDESWRLPAYEFQTFYAVPVQISWSTYIKAA